MKVTARGSGPQLNYLTRSTPTSASSATQKGSTTGTTASARFSGQSIPSSSSSDRNGPAFTHHVRKKKLPLQEPGAKKQAVILHPSAMTSTASLGIENYQLRLRLVTMGIIQNEWLTVLHTWMLKQWSVTMHWSHQITRSSMYPTKHWCCQHQRCVAFSLASSPEPVQHGCTYQESKLKLA